MDPSPYVVNELMPLRRVYRLFNEIGVRHLPVVDCREQLVGIITRKDILPDTIEERVTEYMHTLAAKNPAGAGHGVVHAAKSVVRRASRLGAACGVDKMARTSAAAAMAAEGASAGELAASAYGGRRSHASDVRSSAGSDSLDAERI